MVSMSCRPRPHTSVRRKQGSHVKTLGERLYVWRKENDFSQTEAASKLQISLRTVQEWEQGRAQSRHLALQSINQLIKI